jgi:nucleotide-binding universal stress UspA family protein
MPAMSAADSDGTKRPCVVVGYDGSDAARAALEHAASRAGGDGVVVVVHAYGPPADWLGRPEYQRVLDQHLGRGEALLDSIPVVEGVNYDTDLIAGEPAEAIVNVAKVRDADEIVIGSHGYGRFRSILGSVSHEVLHTADRPVVVVPQAAVTGQESR